MHLLLLNYPNRGKTDELNDKIRAKVIHIHSLKDGEEEEEEEREEKVLERGEMM